MNFADVDLDLARDIARDRERLAAIAMSEERERLAYLDDIADGLISDPDFDVDLDPFEVEP